jgi:hypothetical protein
MKTIFKILLTLFIISFVGCNDLDEEIYSSFLAENFFETEAQIESQSLGLYHPFRHVQWEWYLYEQVSYPNKYTVTGAASDVYWKKVIYATDETNHQNRPNALWTIPYQAINRANNMIKFAPTSPLYENNPELINQYIGEAKWMRAYCYFNLVQLFGDVPLYTEPTASTSEDVLFRGRNPKEEVYDLIIEDLIFASENLPVSWDTPRGRVTKAGAALLLGKVYLTSAGLPLQRTENYQNAVDALKPLADNPGDYDVELVADWKTIFDKDNEDNKEILFALNNVYESGYGGILPHVTTPRNSSFSASNGRYFAAHAPEILDLYDATDIRGIEGFIHSYENSNNGSTITYTRTPLNPGANRYSGNNGICGIKYLDGDATRNVAHERDVIIYRYADAFIMLAEAYNEIGDSGNALEYLKIARDRVNASEIITTNQDELRQTIRDERIREFYGEYSELYDMRRWGTAQENFENHPTRLRRAPEAVWDDKFLLYPIHPTQIAINPNLLPNNPGW